MSASHCYLINLPRRHLILDIRAHLSLVFKSGMLRGVGMGWSASKGLGAAGAGDSVSSRLQGGGVQG